MSLAAGAFAALVRVVSGVHARWRAAPVGDDGRAPQRVYFANHASNLDAPTIWAALPPALRARTRPVAAQDYWEKTALRRYVAQRVLNCVLIERQKVTRAANPLVPMGAALAAGDSLILFPEGTRATDEDAGVAPFRPGLFHLARQHPTVELVPVYLENLSRILPKGEWLPAPILAAATFGEPVALGEGEAKQAFLDRARAALCALHEEPARC